MGRTMKIHIYKERTTNTYSLTIRDYHRFTPDTLLFYNKNRENNQKIL